MPARASHAHTRAYGSTACACTCPGELFISSGIVFLDPGFATELLRPLVDHQLTCAADAEADVHKFVCATPGLASDAGVTARLLGAIDAFVGSGLMDRCLLPFFWRATALAPSDYAAAEAMLLEAGVLLEMPSAADETPSTTGALLEMPSTAAMEVGATAGSTAAEAGGGRGRLMMPMRMCTEKPAGVAAAWPSGNVPEGQVQVGVRFDLNGSRLPPGVIERCVGGVSALEGCRLLECWRRGALLEEVVCAPEQTGGVAAGGGRALLELTSVDLRAEVRGEADGQGVAQHKLLARVVGTIEHVLREYPGFPCVLETI